MSIEIWVHVICWGLPLLLTVLPLTTTDYGTFDGEDGWCFLRPRNGSPKWTFRFWLFAAFFAWVYIAITIFALFILYVAYIIASPSGYRQTDSIIATIIRKAINKLIWYPLIILVSWFVMTIYELWAGFYPNEAALSDPTFMYFTFSLPLLSGLLTSTAFFCGCSEARRVVLQEWIYPISSHFDQISISQNITSLFSNSSSKTSTDIRPSVQFQERNSDRLQDNHHDRQYQQSSSSSSQVISPLVPNSSDSPAVNDTSDTGSNQDVTKIPMRALSGSSCGNNTNTNSDQRRDNDSSTLSLI